jgi:tRNA-dihydrouridine synthase B
MEETGCDFVMIARGALGNPWIFREALALWEGRPVPAPPERTEKIELIINHFDLLLQEKGEYAAVREMRKHAGWYLKGIPGSAGLRRRLNTIVNPDELKETIAALGT